MGRYKDVSSKVSITFVDGEVKDYIMTASPGIVHYLAREAAANGMLIFRDDKARKSQAIPMAQIRNMEIEEIQYVEGEDD